MKWLLHRFLIAPALLSCLTATLAHGADFPVSTNSPALTTVLHEISGPRHPANVSRGEALKVILQTGVYSLQEPLVLSPGNFGTNSDSLSIEAAPGAHPVLSGGLNIRDWRKLPRDFAGLPKPARGKTWVAAVPKMGGKYLEFRQLWVNGQKAVRARTPNAGSLLRLVGWDRTHQTATIPAAALADVKSSARLEMIIDQVWEIADLRIKNFRVQGTNAFVTFQEPEGGIEFQHPWPPVTVNSNYAAPFFLANALPFLDSPGEWFEDLSDGKVYYWPRDGENLADASVCVPAIETLVRIEGSANHAASPIQFKGITFAYTTWLRPSKEGHVPLQAGMYLLKATKLKPRGTPYHPGLDNLAWVGRPPAAVEVENADQVSFENCAFEHLASSGLDFEDNTHDELIKGCIFHDIGGNGLQIGKFSDSEVETHVPYRPSDEREICARVKVADNVLSDCANEDWGCVGICAGYVRETTIEHNDVSDLPYTGISLGWGWTKMTNALRDNLVFANRVHDIGRRLGDLGGIYTLSAQPGTVIEGNAISGLQPGPYVPDPKHWYYLYLDEGSSFITVRDNWCPAEKFLRNANGPGNVWTNNGPQVSEKIKNAAGLEPAYRALLSQPLP